MRNSQAIAEELREVLIKAAKLRADEKEQNVKANSLKAELAEAMQDEECSAVEVKGLMFKPKVEQDFSLDKEVVGTNRWDECPQVFDFFKEIGEGGIIKTKVSVAPQTRKKVLRVYLEDGGELPPWIQHKLFSTVDFNGKEVERQALGVET